MTEKFVKMHGLGNDFVIIDTRTAPLTLSMPQLARLADRHRGVGCDQVIILSAPQQAAADIHMQIFNPDGSEVGACGNATRCVGALVMDAQKTDRACIETAAGLLEAHRAAGGLVKVKMGAPRLAAAEMPLSVDCDTLALPLNIADFPAPVGVNMGNPHCVFFVADGAAVPLATVGPLVENHALFPQRTNVEIVTVEAPDRLRMRVWERGTGLTQACGTGACAALVAAVRRGLCADEADVVMDGGTLRIAWRDGIVWMTGPVATSFLGTLSPTLFDGVV